MTHLDDWTVQEWTSVDEEASSPPPLELSSSSSSSSSSSFDLDDDNGDVEDDPGSPDLIKEYRAKQQQQHHRPAAASQIQFVVDRSAAETEKLSTARNQELALASLVWQICIDVRRRAHNAAVAERTFAWLLRRQRALQLKADLDNDETGIELSDGEIDALANQNDSAAADVRCDSDLESLATKSPSPLRSKQQQRQPSTTTIDDDLAEIERAIAADSPPVRCHGLPQPPLQLGTRLVAALAVEERHREERERRAAAARVEETEREWASFASSFGGGIDYGAIAREAAAAAVADADADAVQKQKVEEADDREGEAVATATAASKVAAEDATSGGEQPWRSVSAAESSNSSGGEATTRSS